LKQHQSKRKVLLSGFLFTFAVFVSYTAMWFWLKQLLKLDFFISIQDYLKMLVWIWGILIWLANLKDYFWYWKWFKFEVPDSWRPTMNRIVKKVTSPLWAFFVGFLISLFLLPCSSGPYVIFLWYFWTSSDISEIWKSIYIIIYNLIFIIPMLIITFIVSLWIKDIAELKEQKELNVEKLHLITWIVMLLLWIYVLYTVF
jgi:cytochrome c biogenesis protein CcdA